MASKGLLIIILLCLSIPVSGENALIYESGEIDGLFIGEYLEYLSEGDLFPLISGRWTADEEFRAKVNSGRLSTDRLIIAQVENVPGGYRSFMTLRSDGRSGTVDWGIDDVLKPEVRRAFRPAETNILRCDFTPHSWWLSFTVDNRSGSQQTLYLELDKYLFSTLDVYYSIDGEPAEERLDFIRPMAERRVKNRNLTAVLRVPPGKTEYTLRVDSWFDDIVPLRLWTVDSYLLYVARDNAVLGMIAGIFLLVFLYAVFVSFMAKNRSYLYLSALTLCTFIVHLTVSGFGFQHLWPGSPATGIRLFYLAFALTMIFTLLFCRSFIPEDRRTGILDSYIFILSGLIGTATAVMFFVPVKIQSMLFTSLYLLDHVYYLPLFLPAINAVRRKDRSGFFLLAALGLYAASQAEWILTNRNFIPYELVNYLSVKGLLFVVLMAAGLFFKFKAMSGLIADYRKQLEKISDKLTTKTVTDEAVRKIAHIREFIKDNYREEISREGLASAADMSPDHLGRIFKKSVGVKLADYINDLRIKDAAHLLREDPEQKIIDIAFDVGFNSLRTFNKVFIKTYGKTPTDYRKSSGKGSPAPA